MSLRALYPTLSLDLISLDTYQHSGLQMIQSRLKSFFGEHQFTFADIKDSLLQINVYPHLQELQSLQPADIFLLDEQAEDIAFAEKIVCEGKCFWEHAAAGEGTRLGLGTKYTIDLSLYDKQEILQWITDEAAENGKLSPTFVDEVKIKLSNPQNLLPLSLGSRHMLQLVYDLRLLAKKYKIEPSMVLEKQKMLIVLNSETASTIIAEFHQFHFFSFLPANIYFMIQHSFPGILLADGTLFYDEKEHKDNKRLHNHGQMVMQKLHDCSIFHFVGGKKTYISVQEYLTMLEKCDDMVSYNIEDVGYLNSAIDYASLGLALQLGKKGYNMVMEVVGQNQLKPQKGGAAFYDPLLGKNVMIESTMLNDYDLSKIQYLNKNCNHYPQPVKSLRAVQQQGLPLPITVKKGKGNDSGSEFIYFCPVQGDINFLVKTAFVLRKELKSIQNWKSPITVIPTLIAMEQQDQQAGFKELARELEVL